MKLYAWRVVLWVAWAAWAACALWTTPAVPFHPDEATHLYLSADFDQLVLRLDPAGVTWLAPDVPDDVRRYRLLEAPLSRYLIGLSLNLAGLADQRPPVDWNWSASWVANAAAGAVPDFRVLTAARLPAALLTVLAPLLLFDLGRRMTNPAGGVTAAALYAVSGVALLHGRRAMSEGPLLFCGLLAAWLAVRMLHEQTALGVSARRQIVLPALLGGAVALASAAKLSGWALLPVAAAAVLAAGAPGRRWRALRLAALLLCVVVSSWLFNPALWSAPIAGLRAMAAARTALLTEQVNTINAAGAGHVLGGLDERVLAELYHTFLAPLAFWDIPNYAAQTAAAEQAYQARWLSVGLRFPAAGPRLAAGGFFLTLSVAGAVIASWQGVRSRTGSTERQAALLALLLAVWTVATAAGLFAFDLAWQRYYLPLLPVACLWAGYAVGSVAGRTAGTIRRS